MLFCGFTVGRIPLFNKTKCNLLKTNCHTNNSYVQCAVFLLLLCSYVQLCACVLVFGFNSSFKLRLYWWKLYNAKTSPLHMFNKIMRILILHISSQGAALPDTNRIDWGGVRNNVQYLSWKSSTACS